MGRHSHRSSSWTSRTQTIGGATQTATLADWSTTLSNGVGWAVVQQHNNNATTPNSGSPIADAVYVVFTPSASAQVNFSSNPIYWGAQKQAYMTNTDNDYVYSVRIQFDDLGTPGGSDQCTPVISMALREPSSTPTFWENESVAATSTLSSGGYSLWPLFVNASINYPSGYEGVQVPSSSAWADLDGDGLIAAEESTQGTSNANKDTDGDGLDDFVESQWYPDRDDVFCGMQCAYLDPTVKDIYVEIDWMKDTSSNIYKPSSTQLGLVEDMFDDKGINFHADTGQFGGGNELDTYTQTLPYTATSGQIDFWDYRNGGDGIAANFSSDRNLIWRYMIFGYNYAEVTGSSGWAETMGDDLFISGGLIENMSGLASLDRAIAGTMAHEIGHNLCLSDSQVFVEQPTECVFSCIDNNTYKPQNYQSVMNYRISLLMTMIWALLTFQMLVMVPMIMMIGVLLRWVWEVLVGHELHKVRKSCRITTMFYLMVR